MVVTTDFFTPVVDDAYFYGAIAAANSISDIYAMGGKPFMALNISAFPGNLPGEITAEILRGGAEKAREAGVVIAGGHTVTDPEPKFGMAVLGFVATDRMMTKGGLKPGEVLYLTKPLGFGLTTTALKQDKASEADVAEAVRWMCQLNAEAGRIAVACGVHGATDVTGFGLAGHAHEMSVASGVELRFDFGSLPSLAGARRYAEAGAISGGLADNMHYFEPHVRYAAKLDEPSRALLFDPQTSGGLLLGVPSSRVTEFERMAKYAALSVWRVGSVTEGIGITID